MKRTTLLAVLAATLIGGCGGSSSVLRPSQPPPPQTPAETAHCTPPPGTGTMGICAPKNTTRFAAPRISGALIPDVSEYQRCPLYSEAVVRVYEAGTERQDSTARCHIAELHRLGAWGATYAFTRPGHGGCRFQADRAVSITRALGGVSGPVIDDAEVPETFAEVSCFMAEVKRQGYPAVEYTCPGCADPKIAPVWIAAYPFRPPGSWVAHQFSDHWSCRGIVGDCSIDEGIRQITRVDRTAIEARIRVLRYVLVRYGCRRRVAMHERLGPRCKRWFREGDRLNAELR